MYGLILVIHVLVAFFLIIVILLQGGRGGLGETLGGAAAQSLFGGGANTVMTKVTAICAALFMVTCLSLAVLSTSAKSRSVIDRMPAATPGALPTLPLPAPEEVPQPPTPSSAPSAPSSTAPTPSTAPTQTTP